MDGQRFDKLTRALSRRMAIVQTEESVATSHSDGLVVPPDQYLLVKSRRIDLLEARKNIAPRGTCGTTPADRSSRGTCSAIPTDAAPPAPVRTVAARKANTFQPPLGQELALSPREQEVASLVAEGLRNREIASILVLSERTVHGHVRNILSKLGLTSRTQIATWGLQHGLLRSTAENASLRTKDRHL
jgi:DNA-binding NarL/FixJ family response regulator